MKTTAAASNASLRLRSLLILGLLTLFGGAIRFVHLGHPSLWYDESMVFRRTCGSYGQLLDCLRTDGFVPLHYSLVWVISRFCKLTPVVLRFFPAFCGTLTVPAIYFLARQLLPRNTSLLAAAITASSAFMLFYSRDAKMYMDAWLFVTLNNACLLWWFRTRRSTAWLCWIATGCAACGLHMSSAIPLAISPLLLLSQRAMRWQQSLLWLMGLIVIVSGPIGYYGKFNTWTNHVEEDGWERSGLEWISDYNYGRTGPQLLRYLSSSMMMGWEWPKDADLKTIPSGRVIWPERACELLMGILIAACLPWPRSWNRSCKNSAEDDTCESQWRVALWLSLWIVVPIYGFYCHSMQAFASPIDWWHWLIEEIPMLVLPMHHHWLWILFGIVIAGLIATMIRYAVFRPVVFRGMRLLAVIAFLISICGGIAVASASLSKAAETAGKPWESLWVPRYMGFIWPMLTVAVAALLMRLPTRPVRAIAIIFLLGLNLGIGLFRVFGQTEPPVDLMAADTFEAENSSNHTLIWTHMGNGGEAPGYATLYSQPGEYYLELLENKPTDPILFNSNLIKRQKKNPGMWRMPWDRDLPADINRIILWNEYDPGTTDYAIHNPLPNWKLQSDRWYQARDCWIWKDLARYRRSTYVKVSD